ncbi:hypothetical protein HDV01_000178 [Terramyces sp. JEL0728]|nr:hypothetical protein HDV01_000178 [Terramyces sp. JEL0728]
MWSAKQQSLLIDSINHNHADYTDFLKVRITTGAQLKHVKEIIELLLKRKDYEAIQNLLVIFENSGKDTVGSFCFGLLEKLLNTGVFIKLIYLACHLITKNLNNKVLLFQNQQLILKISSRLNQHTVEDQVKILELLFRASRKNIFVLQGMEKIDGCNFLNSARVWLNEYNLNEKIDLCSIRAILDLLCIQYDEIVEYTRNEQLIQVRLNRDDFKSTNIESKDVDSLQKLFQKWNLNFIICKGSYSSCLVNRNATARRFNEHWEPESVLDLMDGQSSEGKVSLPQANEKSMAKNVNPKLQLGDVSPIIPSYKDSFIFSDAAESGSEYVPSQKIRARVQSKKPVIKNYAIQPSEFAVLEHTVSDIFDSAFQNPVKSLSQLGRVVTSTPKNIKIDDQDKLTAHSNSVVKAENTKQRRNNLEKLDLNDLFSDSGVPKDAISTIDSNALDAESTKVTKRQKRATKKTKPTTTKARPRRKSKRAAATKEASRSSVVAPLVTNDNHYLGTEAQSLDLEFPSTNHTSIVTKSKTLLKKSENMKCNTIVAGTPPRKPIHQTVTSQLKRKSDLQEGANKRINVTANASVPEKSFNGKIFRPTVCALPPDTPVHSKRDNNATPVNQTVLQLDFSVTPQEYHRPIISDFELSQIALEISRVYQSYVENAMEKVYLRVQTIEQDKKIVNKIKAHVGDRIEKTLEFKKSLERICNEIKSL